MVPAMFAALTILGLAAGAAIGCVGVGGIIIVPILVGFFGIAVQKAIAVAVTGYVLTGIVGTWVHLRRGTLELRSAWILCIAAMPTAILGTLATSSVPAPVLEFIVAAITLSSGIYTLVTGDPALRPNVSRNRSSGARLTGGRTATLGAVAGFLSALTGTGGPAVLLPLLMWLEAPPLEALGLAQVIQLPIAGLATATNAMRSQLDLPLSLVLGLGLTVGAWLGARLAKGLDAGVLRRLVAATLVVGGLGMFAKGTAALGSEASTASAAGAHIRTVD